MPIGSILLLITGVLIYFGLLQRVLDRMKLNDKTAILFIGAMIVGSYLPSIPLWRGFSLNIGGGLIPVVFAIYLIVTADDAVEKTRSIISSLVTGAIIYGAARVIPAEPHAMLVDPIYVFGIIAGIVAYIAGRSRRAAFIAGVLGIVISDIIYLLERTILNLPGSTVIGGAGVFDTSVVAAVIAVGLAEIIGEAREKIQGGTSKADLHQRGGPEEQNQNERLDDDEGRDDE
jgi:uncharacterized membrane protein